MSNYKTKLTLLALLMGAANAAPVKDEDEELAAEANQPGADEEENKEQEPAGEHDKHARDVICFCTGVAGIACSAVLVYICFGKASDPAE